MQRCETERCSEVKANRIGSKIRIISQMMCVCVRACVLCVCVRGLSPSSYTDTADSAVWQEVE